MALAESRVNEASPGPPVPALPPQCQSIQDQLTALQVTLAATIAELKRNHDPDLRQMLHILGERQAVLQEKLSICIDNSLPHFPPLEGVFRGVATVKTTSPGAEGPFLVNVRLRVLLNATRTLITITDFPPLRTGAFDTPIGSDDVTVTQTSGGFGSYSSGAIWMPIGLHFEHEISIPGSELSVDFATTPPGSPLHPEPFGAVTLAASGTFVDGYLGGQQCTIVISGTIDPAIPLTVPDVGDETPSTAISDIEAVGLVVVLQGPNTDHSWVSKQSPPGGSVALRGDTVTLTLSTGPKP
jgi:hypothetical protein